MSDAKDQLETNFRGSVRVVKAALPVMRAQRAGVFAKRLLPYRLFERAARSSLGV
jgi:NAD(P)-dependent dehydrogenase (short-subunit alcohol dehydrogenase family)